VAEKLMRKQGKMTLVHVNPNVREVLDMTGFLQFLNVEE
jgi:anti-sigma B factor antagonist